MSRNERPVCETEKSIFATRLREAMSFCGENQTSLAKKITERFLPIQRQTISLYMSGQSCPDTERLIAICQVLEVSADYLLGFTDCADTDLGVRAAADYIGLDELSISNLKKWVLRGREAANELFDNIYFEQALDCWTEWVDSETLLANESDLNKVREREDAADIAWCRMRRSFDLLLAYDPVHGGTVWTPSPAGGRDLMHRLETYKQREDNIKGSNHA